MSSSALAGGKADGIGCRVALGVTMVMASDWSPDDLARQQSSCQLVFEMVISPRQAETLRRASASLAIFMKATASCLSAPEVPTDVVMTGQESELVRPVTKSLGP